MNKKYEAIFVIKNGSNQKIKDTINKINDMVENEKCKIYYKDELGLKKLAYQIKGESVGYYYLINFESSDKSNYIMKKVEKKINTIEDVIKHIEILISDED